MIIDIAHNYACGFLVCRLCTSINYYAESDLWVGVSV